MTRLANSFGSWRPEERTRRRVAFVFLLISTATLLTNAYYLQFAEPALSRKIVAFGIIALTAIWFLVSYFGLPGNREELTALLRRAQTPVLVVVILSVAFAVRYDGIESGLPQSYIPDEYEYVHSYLQMIKRGDMNPRWWHHPSVQPYVNVATYLVVFFLEARMGRWKSVQELQADGLGAVRVHAAVLLQPIAQGVAGGEVSRDGDRRSSLPVSASATRFRSGVSRSRPSSTLISSMAIRPTSTA